MTTVVITGFGAFTPLGEDAPSTWQAMLDGVSGAHTLQHDWARDLPVTFAAEAVSDPAAELTLCYIDDVVAELIAALRE